MEASSSTQNSFFLVALSNRAEKAYKSKNWKDACKYYDDYFKKVYKNQVEDDGKEKATPEDKDKKKMTLEDALKLLHYAECLYEQIRAEQSFSKFDQEDVDSMALYFLSARKAYEENPDESIFPLEKYIDTYELLGQVALKVNQFKNAQKEFSEGYKKAVENKCGWRIRLSLLFNKAIALEMQEKPDKAIKTIDQGINLIDEELSKGPTEDDKALMDDFKDQLTKKKDDLKGDLKEQEENKDTLINDEEEENEEEDNNDENDKKSKKEPEEKEVGSKEEEELEEEEEEEAESKEADSKEE